MLRRIFLGKVLGENRNVFAALAQRRQRERNYIEPVVKIGAELAALDHGGERNVGGGDDADVDVHRRAFTETFELALLQDTRRSFGCRLSGISPISSSRIVPPSASSNLPGRFATAPVNAPFPWPNSSLSSNDSGTAAQLTATNGLVLRSLESWMNRASSSLPVPLSASIRTSAPVLAAARAR